MPFSKFIVFPIFVALQAAAMMFFAPMIWSGSDVLGKGFVVWIAFQSWAMYFLGGCSVKMAGKTIIGYIGGICASIAIIEMAGVFSGLGTFGLPAAVFVVVIPVMCVEKIKILDFIPAWFMGSAVFFSFKTGYIAEGSMGYMEIAAPEMIACVTGLAFGWVTVTFRTKYEAMVMPAAKKEENKDAA
ncbi:MAG: DUF1097 domain-containing protein [Phycisphaerae bacterium]|nr:DUF1097 domain-containing protein [Phycisphaerae bacterium]